MRPRRESWDPRKQVDELPAHHLPAVTRAAGSLLLVRPEARLHDGQARPPGTSRRARKREGHDGVDVSDNPRPAQLPLRFDLPEAAVHDSIPAGLRLRLE